MSDLNPSDLEKLRTSLENLGISARDVDLVMGRMIKSFSSAETSMKRFERDLNKANTSVSGMLTNMALGREKFKDLSREIDSIADKMEDLEDQIEDLGDATDAETQQKRQSLLAEKASLDEKKKSLSEVQRENKSRARTIDSLQNLGTSLGQLGAVATRSIAQVAQNMYGGSSPFATLGTAIGGIANVAKTGTGILTSALQGIGTAGMMFAPGPWKALGLAVYGAGTAVGAFTNTVIEVTKELAIFMTGALENLVESFNKASSAGALFTGGMTEIYNSALQANLTVAQFSQVLASNNQKLAASGLTVGEAAKLIGNVGNALKITNMDANLMRLGYTYQDQADLMADVISDIQTYGNAVMLKDPNGIAQTVQEYAKNLRTIADITGDDARKRMDETRKQTEIYAFRAKELEVAKRLGMNPEQTQKFIQDTNARLALMDDTSRRAFIQTATLGTTTEKAVYMMSGYPDAISESVKQWDTTGNTVAQSMLDYADTHKEANDQQLIAISQAAEVDSSLSDLARSTNEIQLNNLKVNSKTMDEAKSAADKQMRARDELTNKTVQTMKDMTTASLMLQDIVKNQLGNFAKYSGVLVDKIKEQIEKISGLNQKTVVTTEKPSSGSQWATAGKNALGYGSLGATLGGMTFGLPGALIGGGTGAVIGALSGLFNNHPNTTAGTAPAVGLKGAAAKNLNPGNLRYAHQEGATVGEGGFAQFPTVDAGTLALARDIEAKLSGASIHGKLNTLSTLVPVYAPPKENDTEGYILKLSKFMNLDPKAPIRTDPGTLVQLLTGIEGIENYGDPIMGLQFIDQIKSAVATSLGIDLKNIPEYAKGGITSGPSIVGEAGPEAVVPLPDGRTIPVHIDIKDQLRDVVSATIKSGSEAVVPSNDQIRSAVVKSLGIDSKTEIEAIKNSIIPTPVVANKTEGNTALLSELMPDGRNIPVKMDTSELIGKLDEVIRVLKDHKNISEKQLYINN